MTLMTHTGEVTIEVPYGQDRETGQWVSPVRVAWGLESHQRVTPELQQRLCLTAAATYSYERAAEVIACWGGPLADDSTIHRHVQRAGRKRNGASGTHKSRRFVTGRYARQVSKTGQKTSLF